MHLIFLFVIFFLFPHVHNNIISVVALAAPMLALRVPAVHALAVHACFMRACASHARVACSCCACPCCACPRCALSCGVWCACAAPAYIVRRSLTSPTPHSSRTQAPWHTVPTTDQTHTLPVFVHFLIPFKGPHTARKRTAQARTARAGTAGARNASMGSITQACTASEFNSGRPGSLYSTMIH